MKIYYHPKIKTINKIIKIGFEKDIGLKELLLNLTAQDYLKATDAAIIFLKIKFWS